eukprot:363335-Chlamydomonas_euryale.AAC.2
MHPPSLAQHLTPPSLGTLLAKRPGPCNKCPGPCGAPTPTSSLVKHSSHTHQASLQARASSLGGRLDATARPRRAEAVPARVWTDGDMKAGECGSRLGPGVGPWENGGAVRRSGIATVENGQPCSTPGGARSKTAGSHTVLQASIVICMLGHVCWQITILWVLEMGILSGLTIGVRQRNNDES